jgi:hypothetical protein
VGDVEVDEEVDIAGIVRITTSYGPEDPHIASASGTCQPKNLAAVLAQEGRTTSGQVAGDGWYGIEREMHPGSA